jgi:hypothetical protein
MTISRVSIFGFMFLWFASSVHSASHDEFLGDGVRSHYVALTGHGADNDANRKNIRAYYESCLKTIKLLGRTVKSNESMPNIIHKISVEIYYAENRTLEILDNLYHSINVLDCGVESTQTKVWTLTSSAGICRANLIKNIAEGMCDFKAHERARGTGSRTDNAGLHTIDLSKVPPHARAQVEAVMKANAGLLAGSSAPVGFVNTMKTNNVAGVPCQIYQNESLKIEHCMAAIDPKATPQLNPSTVGTWGLNGGLTGILLQLKSPALTLDAQTTAFNLSVTSKFFDLPAGIKVSSIQGAKP